MAGAPFIPHVVHGGERWDSLAWKYYGDPTQINAIIMANPTVPIDPVLPEGATVEIPLLQQSAVTPTDLPPWGTL